MIRAVSFDYGDTLVVAKKRDEEIIPLALRDSFDVFKKHGLKMSYKDFVEQDQTIFGKYAKLEKEQQRDIPDKIKNLELIDSVLPGLSSPKRDAIAVEADNAFWGMVARCYTLRTGTKSALRELARMGLRMAIISNHHNADALKRHLNDLGISSYFSQVVVSSEFPYRKPDARIFRKCVTLLGVKASQSVFVGDSPAYDIVGAKRAGMISILVANSSEHKILPNVFPPEPDYKVQNLKEVPRIVNSLVSAQ